MIENVSKILNIIKKTVNCTVDCTNCPDVGACQYKNIANTLIQEGVILPVLCQNCAQFDPDLGICKIRHDSYGSVLERGPHDWCSDANRKEN